jgi:hypothetical protein
MSVVVNHEQDTDRLLAAMASGHPAMDHRDIGLRGLCLGHVILFRQFRFLFEQRVLWLGRERATRADAKA